MRVVQQPEQGATAVHQAQGAAVQAWKSAVAQELKSFVVLECRVVAVQDGLEVIATLGQGMLAALE